MVETREYASRFEGKDNYGKPWAEYIEKVAQMTDEQIVEECEQKIWLSAFAANNPRSDYHTHVDILWAECHHRGKEELYSRGYEQASET
jgi:hypothetical protein